MDIFAIAVPGGPLQVVYPDIPDNFRTRLDLQWPIYTGGRGDALERAARAERGAIEQGPGSGARGSAARDHARLLGGRDRRVKPRPCSGARSMRWTRTSRTSARAWRPGLIPPNDVSAAEAQASHQRLLSIEAVNRKAIAEADLARLDRSRRRDDRDAAAGAGPPSPARSPAVADLVAAR